LEILAPLVLKAVPLALLGQPGQPVIPVLLVLKGIPEIQALRDWGQPEIQAPREILDLPALLVQLGLLA
jgi:hypothetical protein